MAVALERSLFKMARYHGRLFSAVSTTPQASTRPGRARPGAKAAPGAKRPWTGTKALRQAASQTAASAAGIRSSRKLYNYNPAP